MGRVGRVRVGMGRVGRVRVGMGSVRWDSEGGNGECEGGNGECEGEIGRVRMGRRVWKVESG